jgi:Holliday junction resolvasome RuvABC endonuclease subunit
VNVLGIDSGLATCGVAALDLAGSAPRLLDSGCFTSEPSKKKQGVRAADDLARRARELATYLETWCKAYSPVAICLEAPSWPRNAGASAKMGAAFGVVYATAHRYGLPLVQAAPQDVKLELCRVKTASKDDVIGAIEQLHPRITWPSQHTLWEHVADAIGIVHACLDAEVIRMARRLSA